MVTKLICIALLSALGIALSACGSVDYNMNKDFVMSGSAEGIRAYNDGLIGMAKTSKESADTDNQYLGYRKSQESEFTSRLIGKIKQVLTGKPSEPEGITKQGS